MAEKHTPVPPDDRSRFHELHKLYRAVMLNVAAGVLKDCHLAEDAVQEAFLRIARNLHKISEVDSPSTRAYVLTIVRNVSLTMLARLERQVPVERLDTEEILCDGMEDAVFDRMNYELALSIIRTLPEIYRETLLLYYVDELNTVEIARKTGVSIETVKKRLQRGKRMALDGLPPDGKL